LTDETQRRRFQEIALPHLDAAYNLARWLTRNDTDAQDVVQEAYLRAFKSFAGFRGADGRPWLLAIVRNTSYTWLRQHRGGGLEVPFDEDVHHDEGGATGAPDPADANPEAILTRAEEARLFDAALLALPIEFREAVVLRDVEDLSYKEIAGVADIPIGTVMSRLARGRRLLLAKLAEMREGDPDGM